jgi:hypothetical protein
MQFTILANALRAVELFAAKADVRYYLNGIYVRALSRDMLQLIATNGHVLGQYRHTRDPVTDEPYLPDESYILPREMLSGIKLTKNCPCVNVTARIGKWKIDYIGGQRSGQPVDANFPDIGRIWPSSITVAPGNFDFRYLALIQKACELLDTRAPTLFQNGPQSSSMFTVGEKFAGIIMPMMPIADSLPDWCQTSLTQIHESLTTRLAAALALNAENATHAYQRCFDAVAAALDTKAESFTQGIMAERQTLKAPCEVKALPPKRGRSKRHLAVVA